MTDQPTQEEIERVRAWEVQRQCQQREERQAENDARWEKRAAGLDGLVGATITKVEYTREEKGRWASVQGSDVESLKITFDTGAIIEYSDLQWDESHIFKIEWARRSGSSDGDVHQTHQARS